MNDLENELLAESFSFNPPQTAEVALACKQVEKALLNAAQVVTDLVPDGKERVVAVNNILAAVFWARHGLTKRQVVMVATMPEPLSPPLPNT